MGENRYYLHSPEKNLSAVSGDARFLYARSHTLDPSSAFSTDASGSRLLYVTTSRDENDWNCMMHEHYFLEMFYVLSGNGQFHIGDRHFPVTCSDLVIINPHVEHTEQSGSVPMEYIVLGVEGMKFTFEDPEAQFFIMNCTYMRNNLQPLFGMLMKEMHTELPYKATICQNLLVQIMRNNAVSAQVVPSQKVSSVIDSVRQYIDANFKLPLSLDILAERCHLSKFYLVHHFTDAFDISPISYLQRRRIEESQYLLVTTDHSLSAIAQTVGFSSASYFSQSFRKIVGVTPQEYRKQQKQAAP